MNDLKVGRIEQLTHTPGPWEVVPSHDGANHQVRTQGGRFSIYLGSTGAPADEWSANARLIAAAPELLDLLQRVNERLTDGRKVPEWASGWAEEITAAIAKAEGRS